MTKEDILKCLSFGVSSYRNSLLNSSRFLDPKDIPDFGSRRFLYNTRDDILVHNISDYSATYKINK
jgi:hypothetical protein